MAVKNEFFNYILLNGERKSLSTARRIYRYT
jgi:hypothetical protein